MSVASAPCRFPHAPKPVRRLVFELGGAAVAFESDDYAWLAFVHERIGSTPAAGPDPFVVRRSAGLASSTSRRSVLQGDGYAVALDCAAREAVVAGEQPEAGTEALIALLASRPCDSRSTG